MASLSSSLLLLFVCCLPLVTRADFEKIDGPDDPGSALFCNETYVAFSEGNSGPPFFVFNDTLYIQVAQPPLRFDVLYYDDDGRAVICTTVPDLSEDVPFSLALFIIIYITTSLAIVGSVALLVTYSLFKKLRTLPGQVIMNLAAAFLAGDILIQIRIAHEHHGISHLASNALQQCLYLTWFVWMSLTGIEMCRSLYSGVRLSRDSKYKRWMLLAVYMCIGWGVPVILMIIMVIAEEEGNAAARDWLGVAGYLTNHVPLAITQLINIGVVVFLSVVFWKAAKRQRRLKSSLRENKVNFVRVFLILQTVLGLVWLIFFALTAWSNLFAVQIVFVLFSVPQPLLVSVAFICTKKVYHMYLKLFGCRKEDYDPSKMDSRSRTFRSGTVTSMGGDLERKKTVTSMFSERELIPPMYKRGPTLATIEEGEEKTEALGSGGENVDTVVKEGENRPQTSLVKNGLYSPTNFALSNGNGHIKSESKETSV